jgi:sporulation protein YlmC with PRC-barrel domain
MKIRTMHLLALTFTAGVMIVASAPRGGAQDPSKEPYFEPADSAKEPAARIEKASALLGREVLNYQDEFLGRIKELAIHLETGEVGEVLLSSPAIGTPDTWIGIAPAQFRIDDKTKVVRVDTTPEKLRLEPRFESWLWIPFTQSNRMDEVYRYKGGAAFRETRDQDRQAWGAWRLINEDTNSRAAISGNVRTIGSPDWAAYLGYLHRASELIGTTVRTRQYEQVGKIEDLMVDLGAGRVAAIIVSSGGFLGMTGEMSPIPAQAFQDRRGYQVVPDPNRLPVVFPTTTPPKAERVAVLDTTRDALDKAPHFSSVSWPDFTKREYLFTVYQAYGVDSFPLMDSMDRRLVGRTPNP